MNSRQRVQAAIDCQPVDRVPLGFYAVDHDTVQKVIGRPTLVRNKPGIQIALWEGRRGEVAESLKKDTVEFYRKIDCADILLPKEAQLLPPTDYDPNPPKKIADDKWEDSQGRIFKVVWEANEMGCIHDPTGGARPYTEQEFEQPLEAKAPDPSVFEVFDYVNEHLGRDRYLAGWSGGATPMTVLGGIENGLMMYVLQPEVVKAAGRQFVARQNRMDQYMIRPGVPGVLVEQDMAGTNGPLISPEMFKEFCLPLLKQRVANIHKHVPQIILHNCGNNIPIMDMLIESGLDCYQSLQTTAGMEIGWLKEKYGGRICFWGGLPVELLIAGTPDDVRKATRTALERGAPGGGFIFGPSHSIAANTKYDNFMAMIDEFVKLRDKF